MKEFVEVTILMPCLNEEETLRICIEKAKHAIEINNLEAEILVADNGSTDSSLDIAQSIGARIIHVNEKGYGNALRAGIEGAKGKFIIMGDSDDSYDLLTLRLDLFTFTIAASFGEVVRFGDM